MARPTKEQIAARQAIKDAEENAKVEARIQQLLPGIVADLTEKMLTARMAAGTTEGVDRDADRNMIESLATAIVKVSDPTNAGRQVDPQVMAQRMAAHDRMVVLIMKFNAEGIVPVYTCRAKMYLDDVLIDPQWQDPGTKRFHDTQIRWGKIPNEGMVPMNDAARAIHAEFKKSIGNVADDNLPKAPWMVPDAPWIQTKDGIVMGRANEPIPEMTGGDAPSGPFADPRVPGFSPAPATPPLPMFGTTGGVKVLESA